MLRAALVAGVIAVGIAAAPIANATPTNTDDIYYPNCSAARKAGAAPIYRGQPGYLPVLDRDGDGIACE
jgi:Excalibur calcium-binding domain